MGDGDVGSGSRLVVICHLLHPLIVQRFDLKIARCNQLKLELTFSDEVSKTFVATNVSWCSLFTSVTRFLGLIDLRSVCLKVTLWWSRDLRWYFLYCSFQILLNCLRASHHSSSLLFNLVRVLNNYMVGEISIFYSLINDLVPPIKFRTDFGLLLLYLCWWV